MLDVSVSPHRVASRLRVDGAAAHHVRVAVNGDAPRRVADLDRDVDPLVYDRRGHDGVRYATSFHLCPRPAPFSFPYAICREHAP